MFCVEGGCGGCGTKTFSKKQNKNKKEKKEKTKKMKKHSVTHFHFDLLLNQIISITHPPIFPQNTSLSLWMNTQTHTSLTHIYHTNQQQSISSPEFKSLPNSSSSFSKQHTQSPSLSQNNHFSCESSKSISSSLLSHSSHLIQNVIE